MQAQWQFLLVCSDAVLGVIVMILGLLHSRIFRRSRNHCSKIYFEVRTIYIEM